MRIRLKGCNCDGDHNFCTEDELFLTRVVQWAAFKMNVLQCAQPVSGSPAVTSCDPVSAAGTKNIQGGPSMNYRTLIVDDEPAACDRLCRMLTQLHAPCNIIGTAVNGFEALALINDAKPDVVFLDIELPGINGIEMLRHCTFDPFIIFTTAYDHYAIEAFDAKAVSYIVKPISESRLLAAISKLLRMTPVPVDTLASILTPFAGSDPVAPLPLLPVKNGETIALLKLESIVWIRSEGKYTVIVTKDKQYVSNYSISELEVRLRSPYFMRVHRSYIINLKYITELRKISVGKMKVVTDTTKDEEIIVGKNYYDLLKRRLEFN